MFAIACHRAVIIPAVVVVASVANVPTLLAAPGDIWNLGTLGGSPSRGWAINDAGQVVGDSSPTGNSEPHAFLYSGAPGNGGAMADLGTLGGSLSYAFGINATGQIAGYSWHARNTAVRAFRYVGTPGSGGSMMDLGTLSASGGFSYGSDINDAGQVTGNSSLAGGAGPHAFIYTGTPGAGGAMADLSTLGGSYSYGRAINTAGQVAGGSYMAGNAAYHAFLYTGVPGAGGAMVDLGTLGGTDSFAHAINDAGQIVGWSDTSGDVSRHAFLYTGTPGAGGAMVDLGTFEDYNESHFRPFDINNLGFVVGSRADRATLWTTDAAHTAVNLDAWLDSVNPSLGADWTLRFAQGINDHGLITGIGIYKGDPGGRAFILDASSFIPEPSAFASVGIAAAFAIRRPRIK